MMLVKEMVHPKIKLMSSFFLKIPILWNTKEDALQNVQAALLGELSSIFFHACFTV